MAPAVWAALIQGGMTLGAAGIAVWGVTRQIGNWRHETRGRRKIEIAEKCLAAAISQARLLQKFRVAVEEGMDLQLHPEAVAHKRLGDEDVNLHQTRISLTIRDLKSEISAGYAELRSLSDLASIYFSEGLRGAIESYELAAFDISFLEDGFFSLKASAEQRQFCWEELRKRHLFGDPVWLEKYRAALQPFLAGRSPRKTWTRFAKFIFRPVKRLRWKLESRKRNREELEERRRKRLLGLDHIPW